jgi:hypothetical protein
MISRPVVVSPVNAILAMRLLDASGEQHDRGGRLLGGLEDDGVAGGQRGRQLPGGHQDREVPRDDLPDHAQRLVEVVGDGVVVDLAQRALLRAQRSGEVPEVVDGQRQIGVERLADRLAVVPRLRERKGFQVRLDAVGDLEQDPGPLPSGRLAPRGGRAVRRVERLVDVGFRRARDLAEGLAGDGRRVLEVLTAGRRNPFAANEIAVAGLERHQCVGGTWACENGHGFPP